VRCILGNLYIGINPSKKGSYFENQGRDKRRKTGTVPGLAANAQHASLKISGVGAFFLRHDDRPSASKRQYVWVRKTFNIHQVRN